MKNATTFILLTLFTLLGVRLAHAETTVDVKSNTNSSSSNNSSVKSKTDIKITTNGETKEFHSDGTSDIDYTSEDGKTRVSVKNNSTSTGPTEKVNDKKPAGTTQSPSQSTPTPTAESTEEESSEDIEVTDNRPFPSSVVERIKSVLNGIASKMFNLFSPNK